MRLLSVLLLVALAIAAVFVALNWSALAAPSPVNLGLISTSAPLGLIALGIGVVLALLLAGRMAVWQATALIEARRHAKEIQAQRTLADQAETSRYDQLRILMHAELEALANRLAQSQDALRTEVHESTNSLAAMIGEMDDRPRPHADLR
jgi:hypothetical protein